MIVTSPMKVRFCEGSVSRTSRSDLQIHPSGLDLASLDQSFHLFIRLGIAPSTHGHLFRFKDGTPLTRLEFTKCIEIALVAAGVSRLHWAQL